MAQQDWLTANIIEYYSLRGLVWPGFDDAMKFVQTEIAEVYEVDLSRKTWVRNNPKTKPVFNKESLGEELGDAIMMLVVAGISEGIDPVQCLKRKIERKLADVRF